MPSRVHVGSVVDKVALAQVFLQVFKLLCQYQSTAPPHSLMYHHGGSTEAQFHRDIVLLHHNNNNKYFDWMNTSI